MIQQITKPFREFFKLEASSGIMLLIAAILALVISNGSYSDEYGIYKQGSVQVRSDDHNHTPVGDAQTGCIGLAYTHGKITFSGKFGKLLNLIAN